MKPLLRDILAKITGGDQRAIRWLERLSLATVPEGGTSGQVLAKSSDDNFALEWVSGGGGGSVAWADVTGKPTFATVATTGAYADLSGLPALFSGAYGALIGIPATFAPSAHTHIIADVTGLQTALDGKEAAFLSGAATITVPNAQYEHEQAVAVVGIAPANRIAAWLAPGADGDENTADLLDVRALAATAGTDQITFSASFGELTAGPISILWSVI